MCKIEDKIRATVKIFHTYREVVSERLPGRDGTLGHPPNAIHPGSFLHVQPVPMDGHRVAQQIVVNVDNDLLILVHNDGGTWDHVVNSYGHPVVPVHCHHLIYRNLYEER